MSIQSRLLKFVTRANWILFFIASSVGLAIAPSNFAIGIISGGLIVTINFHLLSKTLKKALNPKTLSSHNIVLMKYYARFIVSGFIIFVLVSKQYVDPRGLFIGLSVVVASIFLATILEFKKLFFKEAV